jgi:hypothetical protein
VSEKSERWQDYPYLVEWLADMNVRAAKYGVFRARRRSRV